MILTTLQRVFVILQLSLVFSMMAYSLGFPFLEDYYSSKVTALWSGQLIEEHQGELATMDLGSLQRPFGEKMGVGVSRLFFQGNGAIRLWEWLALGTCLLLLFRIKGAKESAFVLLLLAVIAFALAPNPVVKKSAVLPEEKYLIERYLDEPLSQDAREQYVQLQGAWKRYLREEWSTDGSAESARSALSLALLKEHLQQRREGDNPSGWGFLIWMLFVGWNGLFCWVICR